MEDAAVQADKQNNLKTAAESKAKLLLYYHAKEEKPRLRSKVDVKSDKKLNIFDYIKWILKYYDSPRRIRRFLICIKWCHALNTDTNKVQGHSWEKMSFIYTVGPQGWEGFAVDVLQNPRCKWFFLYFFNWTFAKNICTVSIYFLREIPLDPRKTQLPLLSVQPPPCLA